MRLDSMRLATALFFVFGLGCTYHGDDCDEDLDPCRDGRCAPREDGGVSSADGGVGACLDHAECPRGRACIEGACAPASPCETDLDCEGRARCDDRGTCVPVPEDRCLDASFCATEELCVDETCVARDSVCTSDLDCGVGRGCVDNACVPLCTDDAACDDAERCVAAHCVPEPECADDRGCTGGETCVEGRCSGHCATSAECPANELCEAGVCRPDTAPRTFCSSDADCAEGHPCVDGVCRTVCPTGTNEECQRADVQFLTCADVGSPEPLFLCLVRSEAAPECVSATDCATGERCIDALCR